MHLLQKRRQKRPTKIGTRLLGSKMPVPISRSRTVDLKHSREVGLMEEVLTEVGYDRTEGTGIS